MAQFLFFQAGGLWEYCESIPTDPTAKGLFFFTTEEWVTYHDRQMTQKWVKSVVCEMRGKTQEEQCLLLQSRLEERERKLEVRIGHMRETIAYAIHWNEARKRGLDSLVRVAEEELAKRVERHRVFLKRFFKTE